MITFATVFGAVAFKEYANEHGFFLSQRVARGSNPPDSDCEDGQDRLNGETRISVLHTLPEGRGIKKVILAKRHMADVKVRFWAEGGSVEKELLKWFRLHDGWFCDLDTEIAAGATRVLRIWATAEEVLNELQYIKLGYGKDEGGNVCPSLAVDLNMS